MKQLLLILCTLWLVGCSTLTATNFDTRSGVGKFTFTYPAAQRAEARFQASYHEEQAQMYTHLSQTGIVVGDSYDERTK
jgi:hypothetical protein